MKKKIKSGNIKIFTNKITIILVLVTFLSVVSSTYAYLFFTTNDQTTIKGNMSTVNLKIKISQVLPIKASTGVMVPQKSISGSSTSDLATALKNGCVDDNKNIDCQVYKIEIQNKTGKATEIVDGKISFFANKTMTESSDTKMPNLSWKLITSVDTTNNSNSILGTNTDNKASATPTNFVKEVELSTGKKKTYYMIIWFNKTNSSQINKNSTFYGKIEFDSSNGTGVTATF